MKNSSSPGPLLRRYGPWAVIAGASEGLGAAFAGELATVCEELEVGLLVYNAASAPRGSFAETSTERLRTAVAVNVSAPLQLVRRLIPVFARRGEDAGVPRPNVAGARPERRRAGVILMSSLAGDQGTPGIATYAATKAFTTALGQGLWYELRPQGIDVTVCVAGAVRTPGLAAARGDDTRSREAPGTLEPTVVARAALAKLGKRAVVVPGAMNRLARVVMRRLLPSRAAIAIMAASTRNITDPPKEHLHG